MYEVRVTGLRELVGALRLLDRDLPKAIARAHKAIAEDIVAPAARAEAPERTGRLKGTVRGRGTQRAARVSAGTSAVPYAGPVHWGWPDRGIAANEFLVRAAEARAARVDDAYLDEIDRHLVAAGFR